MKWQASQFELLTRAHLLGLLSAALANRSECRSGGEPILSNLERNVQDQVRPLARLPVCEERAGQFATCDRLCVTFEF